MDAVISAIGVAKRKRQVVSPHSDDARRLVDRLVEAKKDEEAMTRILKDSQLENQPVLLDSLLLELANTRDNELIKAFLTHYPTDLTEVFHKLVLKLTCSRDAYTLDTVLQFGKEKGVSTIEDSKDNPISVASENVGKFR